MKSPRKSTTRFVVIEEGDQVEIESPEIKEEQKKYTIRKHSTLQSFGSAPNFTKETKLNDLKQYNNNNNGDNVPKIDLTKLTNDEEEGEGDEKKINDLKKNLTKMNSFHGHIGGVGGNSNGGGGGSPKSLTPRTPSSEASDFAMKIKEYKGIIRGLEKEKKELKEKLNQNNNQNTIQSPKTNEINKLISEFKNEIKMIKENNIERNEIIKDLKLKLSIFENEKKGFTSYSHNPIQNQVTIVCCDIEGMNDILWNLNEENLKKTISIYTELIKEKANETLGYISPSDTDTFIIAFSSIRKAIKFCLLCQITLMELDWPNELSLTTDSTKDLFNGLRVRMGVDSGIPEYIVDDKLCVKYFGDVVHKSLIITSYTQGGQVIISEGAWDALCQSKEKSDTPIRTVVQDLGLQDLKGINKKEHVRLIIPEQFKGRKFKSKSLQLVWNDSSILVSISKQISKLKFENLKNENLKLFELENKIINLISLQKLIDDLSCQDSNSEIKLKQDELKLILNTLKDDHFNFNEKLFQLESQISKLNSSIMFYGGNTSTTTTTTIDSKKSSKSTPTKPIQSQNQNSSSTFNFNSPNTPVNDTIKFSDEELKQLKIENDSSMDQLKKLIEIANLNKIQLEEQLKEFD